MFSDVHANLHALEAVWAHIEREVPDTVYCLGDLVGYGAYPNEVIEFIKSRDIPTVMGNYDEGVGFDLHDCGCAYKDSEQDRLGKLSLSWSREHTSDVNKEYLQSLQRQIRLENIFPTYSWSMEALEKSMNTFTKIALKPPSSGSQRLPGRT